MSTEYLILLPQEVEFNSPPFEYELGIMIHFQKTETGEKEIVETHGKCHLNPLGKFNINNKPHGYYFSSWYDMIYDENSRYFYGIIPPNSLFHSSMRKHQTNSISVTFQNIWSLSFKCWYHASTEAVWYDRTLEF